jgi:ATP-dependent Clp protease protease subunit
MVKKNPASHMARSKADFKKAASSRKQPKGEMTIPNLPIKGKEWSIISELLKTRTIRLDGEVNDNVVAIINSSIDYLETQNPNEPIHLILNSPGGVVTDGLAIVDRMRNCHCPIHTYAYGFAASMASIILVAGNKRYASPNAEIMIHQPWGGGSETANQTQSDLSAFDMRRTREKMTRIYAEETGLRPQDIDKLTELDHYMPAERALSLGLIDEILTQDVYFNLYYSKSVPEGKRPRFPDNTRKEPRKSIEQEFNDIVNEAIKHRLTVPADAPKQAAKKSGKNNVHSLGNGKKSAAA